MTFEEAIKELKSWAFAECGNEEYMPCVDCNIKCKSYTAINMAISALEEQERNRWIPVSERLPKMGKQVLCCNIHGSVFTSAITHISSFGVYFGSHYNVIAWRPLPEPFKGGEL